MSWLLVINSDKLIKVFNKKDQFLPKKRKIKQNEAIIEITK